jgi:hypothetical protein
VFAFTPRVSRVRCSQLNIRPIASGSLVVAQSGDVHVVGDLVGQQVGNSETGVEM